MKRLVSRLLGVRYKEFVGQDKNGNLYYKVHHGNHQKRIALNKSQALERPFDVPPAWQTWMNGLREEIPTDQDCETTQPNFSPSQWSDSHPIPPHMNVGMNHASSKTSGGQPKSKDKSEPESHGDTFSPGSWSPK